jgi:CxxH/CxxC protein (TIGR04129 family)
MDCHSTCYDKGVYRMYVVCKEHLELAIDMFVDEYEDAPDIVDLEKVTFPAWEAPSCCERCAESGRFLVV